MENKDQKEDIYEKKNKKTDIIMIVVLIFIVVGTMLLDYQYVLSVQKEEQQRVASREANKIESTYLLLDYSSNISRSFQLDEFETNEDGTITFYDLKSKKTYTLNSYSYKIKYEKYENKDMENFSPLYYVTYYNGEYSTKSYCEKIEQNDENADIIIYTETEKILLHGQYTITEMTDEEIAQWEEKHNKTELEPIDI